MKITVTATADAGEGSLREAVRQAVDGDVILFDIPTEDPGYDAESGIWTVALTGGEIAFRPALTVKGGGRVILDAGGKGRIFRHTGSCTVTLDGLLFRNGWNKGGGVDGGGGAVFSHGSVTAASCIFQGCKAEACGADAMGNPAHGIGGAMKAIRNIILSDCLFDDNSADIGGAVMGEKVRAKGCVFKKNSAGSAGGIMANALNADGCLFLGNTAKLIAGALCAQGDAVLTRCDFAGNSAEIGGAMHAHKATLTACVFTFNVARDAGGACMGHSVVAALCAFESNAAINEGAAIYLKGDATLINSSLTRNTTGHPASAALVAMTPCLYHSTVADNPRAGGVCARRPKIYAYNSIITGNGCPMPGTKDSAGTNCKLQVGVRHEETGAISPLPPGAISGNSLIDDGASVTRMAIFGANTADEIARVRPIEGGLADKTAQALLPSRIFTAQGVAASSIISKLAIDLLGKPRDMKGRVSYGAVDESHKPVKSDKPLEVTTTADTGRGSLRETVLCAADGDTIVFSIPQSDAGYNPVEDKWVIRLESGEIRFDTELTLRGGGKVALDGVEAARALNHTGTGALTLEGLTFRNCRATVGGYGDGGAVLAAGTVNAEDCAFEDNRASYCGGALSTAKAAKITRCTFTGNAARDSGGAVRARGAFTGKDCTFTDCAALTGEGGAVLAWASFTAEACVFTGCSASHDGGAVCTSGTASAVSAARCGFIRNKTERRGGAVSATGAVDATGCAFAGNRAMGTCGGAVAARGAARVIGCVFTENAVRGGRGGALNAGGALAALNSVFTSNGAGMGHSGAVCAGSARLYHVTIADNDGAGVFLGSPRLFAYNSIIVGNDDAVQTDCGGKGVVGDFPAEAITGTSLIRGITPGVSRFTVFGRNAADEMGIIEPLAGGLADFRAQALTEDGMSAPEGMTAADVIAELRKDISGAPRPATGKVSFGAKE